jgi:hypothetical protein
MTNLLVLLAVIGAVVGVVVFLTKRGKIADSDGDLIPDVVENAVDTVKHRAARVREEAADVTKAVKNVLDQSVDVVKAAGGSSRKGRRPSTNSKAAGKKTTTTKGSTRGRPRKSSGGTPAGADSNDSAIIEPNEE